MYYAQHPGDPPARTGVHDNRLDLGGLLQYLQPSRALTGNDVLVGEWMYIGGAGSSGRLLRGGMLETLKMDYIRSARAKGAPDFKFVIVQLERLIG